MSGNSCTIEGSRSARCSGRTFNKRRRLSNRGFDFFSTHRVNVKGSTPSSEEIFCLWEESLMRDPSTLRQDCASGMIRFSSLQRDGRGHIHHITKHLQYIEVEVFCQGCR